MKYIYSKPLRITGVHLRVCLLTRLIEEKRFDCSGANVKRHNPSFLYVSSTGNTIVVSRPMSRGSWRLASQRTSHLSRPFNKHADSSHISQGVYQSMGTIASAHELAARFCCLGTTTWSKVSRLKHAREDRPFFLLIVWKVRVTNFNS